MKMNKLIGLAMTYVDDASSENEWTTAGRIGKKMIQKELRCEPWVSARILKLLGGKESWFPIPERMHLYGTLPTDASDIFENALKTLNIRYAKYMKKDGGFGGVVFKQI